MFILTLLQVVKEWYTTFLLKILIVNFYCIEILLNFVLELWYEIAQPCKYLCKIFLKHYGDNIMSLVSLSLSLYDFINVFWVDVSMKYLNRVTWLGILLPYFRSIVIFEWSIKRRVRKYHDILKSIKNARYFDLNLIFLIYFWYFLNSLLFDGNKYFQARSRLGNWNILHLILKFKQ